MKVIADIKKPIGGDGAEASGALVLDGGMLKGQIEVSYPLAKALDPVNKIIDSMIDKIEAAVPGDWDKALLEPIRVEAKAALLKLLSE